MSFSVSRGRSYCLWLLVVFASTVAFDASAHALRPAVATLELDDAGTLSVQIKVNAEALLAELGPEHSDTDDAPNSVAYNKLRAMSSAKLADEFDSFSAEFLDALKIESDLGRVALEYNQIVVPDPGDLDLARDSTVELTGQLPSASRHIVWHWSEQYGSIVVRLVAPGAEAPQTTWLQAGQASTPLQVEGFAALGSTGSTVKIVKDYIVLGFKHILPLGADHILFVLALFLLSTQFGSLIWQISAFTIAHTITLGLSVFGLIGLPSSIVEVLIALSIVYVGIENCMLRRLMPWRVALVFVFGLLHGLGFAGVLVDDIGLLEGEFLTALVGFNIGVEIGQLAIVCLALLVVGWCQKYSWYRQVVVIPASLAIACTGLFWTYQRVLG